MNVNKEQIFNVFDDLMAQHVDWRIGTSFRKYATARDDLIQAFSEKTGIPAKEFSNHLATKLAKEMRIV
jgi:hypothetical protein